MTARIRLAANRHWLLFLAMATTVCALESAIVSSPFFMQNSEALAFAITLDITLGIPALYYFLAVRRKHAPALTLIPIFILSLVLASLILPAAQHGYLDLLKLVIPGIELFVLSYLTIKIRAIIKAFRAERASALYFTDALLASCQRVLGKIPGLGFILTEFSLLYCAVLGWFKKYEARNAEDAIFFYHRKSGYGAILSVLMMALVTETLALHILLQQWSSVAAWIFTGLSVYSALWLLGDYHALRLHPIIVQGRTLHFRTGLRWRVSLSRDNIAAVEKFQAREQRGKEYLSLALFGAPRLLLHCKAPVLVRGLFGIKRMVTQIGLSVDEEKLFLESMHARGEVAEMKA